MLAASRRSLIMVAATRSALRSSTPSTPARADTRMFLYTCAAGCAKWQTGVGGEERQIDEQEGQRHTGSRPQEAQRALPPPSPCSPPACCAPPSRAASQSCPSHPWPSGAAAACSRTPPHRRGRGICRETCARAGHTQRAAGRKGRHGCRQGACGTGMVGDASRSCGRRSPGSVIKAKRPPAGQRDRVHPPARARSYPVASAFP